LSETWVRKSEGANHQPVYRAHYDPRIAEPFHAAMPDKDLEIWPVYDAIRCPTLVVRGAQSDLLLRDTTKQMAQRGPKARVAEIPGVGHAPTLMNPEQIAIVRDFLLEGGTS
jgi:pimeloyl-ACP methyl ester carboxylesterase